VAKGIKKMEITLPKIIFVVVILAVTPFILVNQSGEKFRQLEEKENEQISSYAKTLQSFLAGEEISVSEAWWITKSSHEVTRLLRKSIINLGLDHNGEEAREIRVILLEWDNQVVKLKPIVQLVDIEKIQEE
jgi:hypothetical protein